MSCGALQEEWHSCWPAHQPQGAPQRSGKAAALRERGPGQPPTLIVGAHGSVRGPPCLRAGFAAAMGPTPLEPFLAHVQSEPALRQQVSDAITADEVSPCPGSTIRGISGPLLLITFQPCSAAGVGCGGRGRPAAPADTAPVPPGGAGGRSAQRSPTPIPRSPDGSPR